MQLMNAEMYQNVMDALRQACDARADRELVGASFVQESELYECASVNGGKVYLLRGYDKRVDETNRFIVIAAYGATTAVARGKGINTYPYPCTDIEREIAELVSRKQREGYGVVRAHGTQSHQTYALQEMSEREFFAITPAGKMRADTNKENIQPQTINDNSGISSSKNGEKGLTGTILGGGWEHDTFNNPCARVHITINAHHLTMVDDTERGWTLHDLDDAPDTEAAFEKCFGAKFDEDVEFEYGVLRDFVITLERVGSERIAKVYGGKTISLAICRTV